VRDATEVFEQITVIAKIRVQHLGDGEGDVAVGNGEENGLGEQRPEELHLFLVAGRTEPASLAGEGEQVVFLAVSYWYEPANGYMDHVARSYVTGEGLIPIFLTIDSRARGEDLIVDGELKAGKGSIIFSQLSGLNRMDDEPIAFAYYQAILDYA